MASTILHKKWYHSVFYTAYTSSRFKLRIYFHMMAKILTFLYRVRSIVIMTFKVRDILNDY